MVESTLAQFLVGGLLIAAYFVVMSGMRADDRWTRGRVICTGALVSGLMAAGVAMIAHAFVGFWTW